MGALKINCYCRETQMENIVNKVINTLNTTDRWSISDIDEDIEGMRVSVEFDILMGNVRLKTAEVMDADWDVLYEDSAVLTSRLRPLIDDYNAQNNSMIIQSKQIREDQLAERGINSK